MIIFSSKFIPIFLKSIFSDLIVNHSQRPGSSAEWISKMSVVSQRIEKILFYSASTEGDKWNKYCPAEVDLDIQNFSLIAEYSDLRTLPSRIEAIITTMIDDVAPSPSLPVLPNSSWDITKSGWNVCSLKKILFLNNPHFYPGLEYSDDQPQTLAHQVSSQGCSRVFIIKGELLFFSSSMNWIDLKDVFLFLQCFIK